jgi:hypothetical protein
VFALYWLCTEGTPEDKEHFYGTNDTKAQARMEKKLRKASVTEEGRLQRPRTIPSLQATTTKDGTIIAQSTKNGIYTKRPKIGALSRSWMKWTPIATFDKRKKNGKSYILK